MKPVFVLLALCLCSCTTLSDPKSGKPLLFTTANADLLEYAGAGVTLRVVNLRHERVGDIATKFGAAGAAMGLGVGL